jgi:hypothetical protein
MWVNSGIRRGPTLMGKDVFDRPERDHDERECSIGGVEAVGPIDDEPDAAIQSLVPGIGPHRRMHPVLAICLIPRWFG